MEISLKNGDCALGTGVPPNQEDTRTEERKKAKPPRPPITEFRSLVPTTGPTTWSSTSFLHLRNSEPNVLLFRQLPDTDYSDKCERKEFLRSAEHILATFYGVVFVIQENDWKVLKSEYLPIYFVRVSIKNVKYPFRILVVENEKHRAVDFIVNCNTKTSIKEQAVCWQDQEIFGAKFSTISQAAQFYDTISRMISTLKKGEQLENQFLDLEVHLPNSDVRHYPFLKNAKLRDILKFICTKEHLRVNDHYLHHMQLTDDSLNMALTVADIRANVIRVVSKKELRRSSTDILEKVSKSSSRKSGGIVSLFRRRFSRKTKNSRQYSSAPSVLQYTDNIFMVERQSGEKKADHNDVRDGNNANKPAQSASSSKTTQSLEKNGKGLPVNTTPVLKVKRRAPRPPSLVIPKFEESSSNKHQVIVNGDSGTEQRKRTKRRAPSPPKLPETIIQTEEDISEKRKASIKKPPRPSKPPPYSSSNPTSPTDQAEPGSLQNQTAINREKKKDLPVFIAPPPPDTTPPPLDECETPVGPIDIELGYEDSISVGTNSVVGETDSKNTESCDDEDKMATRNVETEVKIPASTDESLPNGTVEIENKTKNENTDPKESTETIQEVEIESKTKNENTDPKESTETIEENVTNGVNVERSRDENENLSTDELRLKESTKDLSPEQLQLLMRNSQNSGAVQTQQDPFNFQNQQFLAMQQNQQMLNSMLIQQMLQQQMVQQRTATMVPVQSVGVGVHPMQSVGGIISPVSAGAVHPMQPVGSVTHVSGAVPVWGGIHEQPVAQVVNHPPLNTVPLNSAPVTTTPETSKPFEKPNEVESADSSLSSISEVPKVEESSLPEKSKDSSAAAAAVKDEELVNRPLFKKMLAQICQGKLKETPTESSSGKPGTNQANVTPLVSPNAKIEKVPTSYVASAEKNIPQTKIVEEKKPPVSLGQIGRKSSYVESAMDRHKIDNEKPTKIEEKKVSFSLSFPQKPEGLVQANVTVMEKISPPAHAEEKKLPLVLDYGTSKPLQVKPALEEAKTVRNTSTSIKAEEKKVPVAAFNHNMNKPLEVDLARQKTKTVQNISSPIKAEEKKIPVVLDHSESKSLQVKLTLEEAKTVRNISTSIKAEEKKVPVVLDHSASKLLQVKPTLEEAKTVRNISTSIKAEEKKAPVVLDHSASKSLQVKPTLEEAKTVRNISTSMKAEEKKVPVVLDHSASKSLQVKPTLEEAKTVRNISTSIKAEEKKVPVVLDHSASKSLQVKPTLEEAKTVRNISTSMKAEEKKVPVVLDHSASKSLQVKPTLEEAKTVRNISTSIKAEEKKVPVVLDHSASKSLQVKPTLEEAKNVRNISSPINAEEKKVTLTPMYNGGQSSSSYNKTGGRKFGVVVPAVRPKPSYQRHMSEPAPVTNPKPIVGPKPTVQPIAKSTTLPKTNKQKHIQLSLSLTAEERLEVSKTSAGLGTNTNTQTKKPAIYSLPGKKVDDVKTNQEEISRL